MGSLITARLAHEATLLPDGRVLVSGGRVYGGGRSTTFHHAELYDPVTRTWTATADMTQARSNHTATLLLDGTVLVAGGGNTSSDPLASAELYDPGSGS